MPTNEEIAEGYGWTGAFINSSWELKQLFNRAKANDWTNDKFQAEFRDTRWFRSHSETWRRTTALRYVDPAEYRKQLKASYAKVKDQAAALGATMSYKQLLRASKHALLFGDSDSELADRMARFIKFNGAGQMVGQAAVNVQALRQTALANGMTFNQKWYGDHARAIARGDRSVEDIQTAIRAQAARAFSGFAKELNAGMDLADIASPYVSSMANLWELNPAQLNMLNPKIRSALSHRDPKTGAAAPLSITDWEDQLRRSPQALRTQWMQDASMSVVHDLLGKWGFVAA